LGLNSAFKLADVLDSESSSALTLFGLDQLKNILKFLTLKHHPMPKLSNFQILIIIIAIATFLRLYNLEIAPPALNQDEAVNGVDAFTLGINLRDHHGNFLPPMLQSFNDWASPTLTYLTVPFVKVFGLSVWSIRFANAFFGILCVPLIYGIVRRLTAKQNMALIAAGIVAITPFMISLSRWAIPPSIVPFCLFAFIFTLVKLIDSDSSKKIILNSSLFTLSGIALTYSYPTMKVFVPLALIALVVIYLTPFLKAKFFTKSELNELPLVKGLAAKLTGVSLGDRLTIFKKLILPIITIFVFISPIYHLTIFQPEIYNSRYKQVSVTANGEGFVGGFASRYWEHLTPYFITGYSDSNEMHHVPQFGPVNELLTPFVYLGLLVCWWKAKEKENADRQIYMSLFIMFFLAPIAPSLTKDHTLITRGIQVLILSLIFIPIAIDWLFKNLNISHKFQKAILTLFGIISLITTLHFSFFYFTDYTESQKDEFQYGTEQMYAYLKDNSDKFDKVEIVDVNIPYIYKLFYEPTQPGYYDTKIMGNQIGKYYFGGVNKDGLQGKVPLTEWKDGFKIYEYQPRWYIVTR
jgi:Na+-transporting NADH:ubiquinone oxidoreductase subunit NqrD